MKTKMGFKAMSRNQVALNGIGIGILHVPFNEVTNYILAHQIKEIH